MTDLKVVLLALVNSPLGNLVTVLSTLGHGRCYLSFCHLENYKLADETFPLEPKTAETDHCY